MHFLKIHDLSLFPEQIRIDEFRIRNKNPDRRWIDPDTRHTRLLTGSYPGLEFQTGSLNTATRQLIYFLINFRHIVQGKIVPETLLNS